MLFIEREYIDAYNIYNTHITRYVFIKLEDRGEYDIYIRIARRCLLLNIDGDMIR